MPPTKTKEQMELEILEAQHQKALLDLDETKEANAQRQQRKSVTARANAERQQGFRIEKKQKADRFALCTHRQGGMLNQLEVSDSNPSALVTMKMPDGFTLRISCPVCRGFRISPHPYLQRTNAFPAGFHMPGGIILERAETAAEVRDRLAKYADDVAEFTVLMKAWKQRLMPIPVMDCGVEHHLIRIDDGMRVYPWRAEDVWPYAEPGYARARRARDEAA